MLEARLASAPEALRHHVDGPLLAPAGELADLLWEGVAGCRFDGRPLAAGWAGVPRSRDPVGALWLGATVLREHRGDGHVLAGVAHGLRGLDATVTFAATGAISRAMVRTTRGTVRLDAAPAVEHDPFRSRDDSNKRRGPVAKD